MSKNLYFITCSSSSRTFPPVSFHSISQIPLDERIICPLTTWRDLHRDALLIHAPFFVEKGIQCEIITGCCSYDFDGFQPRYPLKIHYKNIMTGMAQLYHLAAVCCTLQTPHIAAAVQCTCMSTSQLVLSFSLWHRIRQMIRTIPIKSATCNSSTSSTS